MKLRKSSKAGAHHSISKTKENFKINLAHGKTYSTVYLMCVTKELLASKFIALSFILHKLGYLARKYDSETTRRKILSQHDTSGLLGFDFEMVDIKNSSNFVQIGSCIWVYEYHEYTASLMMYYIPPQSCITTFI